MLQRRQVTLHALLHHRSDRAGRPERFKIVPTSLRDGHLRHNCSMRQVAGTVVVLLAIFTSTTALADEHLMRVDEVLISKDNNTAIQFVELYDPALEPFPTNPYRLEIYDAVGVSKGMVQFTVSPNTQRILVGTAGA